MNPTCLYLEMSQSSVKLLNGSERFEFSLDRQQNGRLTESCKANLTSALQDFLKRKTWQTRLPAWCAIGANGVSIRRLTLPAAGKDELRRLLELQIESEFPLPPEQLAWGYQTLRPLETRQQEILVVAVKKDLIEEYSAVLTACGMTPVFTVAALARNVICPQPATVYSILEIGRSHSELLTFENGAPTSIRVLPWGGDTVTRSIEDQLGVSHEEAEKLQSSNEAETELVPKMRDAFRSALRPLLEQLPGLGKTLYASGKTAGLKSLARELSELAGGTLRIEKLEAPDADFSTAIAGLKKSNEGGSPPPLILQLSDAKGVESFSRPAPMKWAALAAALVAALFLLPFAEAIVLKSRLAKKLSSVKADRGRLAVIDRELNFLQELKKQQSPYLDTVYLVANSTPPGTRFDTFAMNRRGEISMKGNMQNGQQVTDFRAKLIASGFFSSVVVDEQAPTPDRQKVAVRMTAQWKPAAGRKPISVEPEPRKTEKPKASAEGKTNSTGSATNNPPTNAAPSKGTK